MPDSREKPFHCKPRFRVTAGDRIALGPGKVDLLEAIQQFGSISKAAKEINLSYRRAWDMVDTMNQCFKQPLVQSSTGGKGGGGAHLTELGEEIMHHYRAMVSAASKASKKEWNAIKRSLKRPSEL